MDVVSPSTTSAEKEKQGHLIKCGFTNKHTRKKRGGIFEIKFI